MFFRKPQQSSRQREAHEDVSLLQVALDQMWPVTAEQRAALVARQMEIVDDPLVSPTVRVVAAKNLLFAGACNLKAVSIVAEHELQLERRVEPMSDAELQASLAQLEEFAVDQPRLTVMGGAG